MCSIVVVELWSDLIELIENLVVTCHVRCQNASDHSFADAFINVSREGSK